ncbi:hypothetical protein Patl1_17641 [Pistacia atlantica]|uniref:Uncharacterized protein n=1 Tax=Pistacia atlantica TaxID=434234 RepID=A0ACC1BY24_9ROSI|nr:hypothetical protein Patl1_17641 [Pistacia atlantica]
MVSMLRKQEELLSKIASGNGHGENSPYFDGWKAYETDPYHPTDNPNGVIQMGLAENQLCFDLVQDWLLSNPEASICTAEGVNYFRDIAIFQDYHGLPKFRNAVANFMAKVRGNKVKYDPDRIVMSGGATGAHETVAFCLADPGEAFLVPTPYYAGFDRDLRWRTGVQLVPVVCDSSNNFEITREAVEAAYEKAQEDNIRIKVCDEIYAATVFMGQPDFISISEIIEEDIHCNRNLIHIVYSLSKDMGFPGFRVGIIYSYNDEVVSCARKMSSFGLVSSQTQHLIASMLSDDEFVDRFITESAKRLAERHRDFTWGLSQTGIGCLKSNAGLFFWMDLRHLLKEQTYDGEMELWKVIINEVKLNVSPGSSFHCANPGWFRVCFANMDDETMNTALSRIRSFMSKYKEAKMPVKKLCWQRSLRLSTSFRRLDDIMSSPCMSPQSPLVRART